MPDNKVVVYGEIGIDNLISVPQALDYERDALVTSDEYLIGGYACNVGVLLALWQVPTAISGYALGDDEYGRRILNMLGKYPSLDLSYVETRADVKTAFCRVIVIPDGRRTILAFNLYDRIKDPAPLSMDFIGGASHIVLDSLSQRGAFLHAAEVASRAGLCVINSDINTLDCTLIPHVDVICNSAGLLRNKDGVTETAAFARRLHQHNGAAVITTDGANPIHAIDQDGTEFWVTPPAVDGELIVDTTGAGDSLKAGVAYGLVNNWPLARCVRYGAAAGALIIQAVGAVTREPSIEEITAFMAHTTVSEQPHA